MKRLIFCFLLLFSHSAGAKPISILFWYPGEAGTPEQAAPLLATFFDYLNAKTAPLTWQGIYHNEEAKGFEHLTSHKPTVVLLSYPTWLMYKAQLTNWKPWLMTKPLLRSFKRSSLWKRMLRPNRSLSPCA